MRIYPHCANKFAPTTEYVGAKVKAPPLRFRNALTRKMYECRVDSPIGNPPFRSLDVALGMAVCLSAKPPYGPNCTPSFPSR